MGKFFSSKKFRYGGYAVVVILVGIAVVALLNVGLTMLENNYDLKIDTSQNKKYSLTPETKKMLDGLTKDIYVYTTYPEGKENKDIVEILKKFKGASSRVIVENKDVEIDARFMEPFKAGGQTVDPGSIIVSDKDRKLFRVLGMTAQYQVTYDANNNPQYTQIKVEGSLVNAMNYIELGFIPTVYVVQGHGEIGIGNLAEISTKMSEWNYNFKTINIAQTEIKPGDIMLFFNPKQDITDAERDKLKTLTDKGGRFYFLFNPLDMAAKPMPNIEAIMKQFDITLKKGLVVEGSTSNMYMPNAPYVLVPNMESHAITTSLLSSNESQLLMPYCGALDLPVKPPETSMTITPLLTTSGKSWVKSLDSVTGTTPDWSQKPEDETGTFTLAAAAEKKIGTDVNDSVKMVIAYSVNYAADPNANTYKPDMDFFMNGVAWMRNTDKTITVAPKPLSAPMLVISNATEFWLIAVVSVLLVPLLLLVAGIVIYLKRKHL